MEILKKKRMVVRAAFTRLYNTLQRIASIEQDDDAEMRANLTQLQEKMDQLAVIDAEILDLLLNENADQEDLDKEVESADEYAGKFHRINITVQKQLNSGANSERSSVSKTNKRKFKLPALELKKFGGEVKDWLTFWGQFKKIDEDSDIEEEDKFQYLMQATVPNTRARELVESFPPIGSNYRKAIECLKSRFAREDVLVEYYVRELLKLTLAMNREEHKVTLSSLYDRIETQLRALETLGVTTEKYAAMLFPLVESCLSEELLRVWQRSSSNISTQTVGETRLDNLINFLKNEVENEERIIMAVQGFSLDSRPPVKSEKSPKAKADSCNRSVIPTAAGLINLKSNQVCVFCKASHPSESCFKARRMNFNEKQNVLRSNKCCFACLKPGHLSRRCKAVLNCIICEGKHVPLMCSSATKNAVPKENKEEPVVENSLSNVNCGQVFLQTLVVKIRGEGEEQVRVLMDPGSQRSYIRKDTVKRRMYTPIGEENLIHGLFGGEKSNPRHHFSYKVRLSSVDDKYACNFEALDEENICSQVPTIQPGPWLNDLRSRGVEFCHDKQGPIEVLIGADIYGKLLTGRREILQCGLVAIETHLGWIVTGKMRDQEIDSSMTALSMFVLNDCVSNLWELDVLGIQDPCQKKSKEETELAVQAHFLDTVRVNDEGRYEVKLPWIDGHPPVPRNFNVAKRRMEHTVRKLKESNSKSRYEDVLTEWSREGIIEDVPGTQWDEGHYLPHRPVFKENSTTKVRPVFDASSRERGHPSLNQCLEKGINLIEIIPSLLLRFRIHKIGVISDIRKAFLQISLSEEDRDFLRFLWIDQNGVLKIFRHTRVVFGVSSSPFLLGAVIDLHLKKYLELPGGAARYSKFMIEKLRKSFYIDNCVTSLQDREELQHFIKEATEIISEGKFDLRGWEYSDPALVHASETSVLGLVWCRKEDTLTISPNSWKNVDTSMVSQRTMLSIAQRVFDPIGFTCPTSLCPKLLLQQCWTKKGGWDVEVSENVKETFLLWLQELPLLEEVKIPRWLMGMDDVIVSCSVHTFCDASRLAYAAVVFVRIELSSCVNVQLIQAKSRVAPLQQMTIPRLELLAATIGARLGASVRKVFCEEDTRFFFWSDSSTVIAWIKREENWGVFVWNRVREIRSLSRKDSWRHVPGALNPADLPSRGCSARQLLESRWWEGPPWLKMSSTDWPSCEPDPDEELVMLEQRKEIVPSLLCKVHNADWYYSFTNNFDKIVSVIAWILRFITNCRHKRGAQYFKGKLLCKEIVQAEKCIIKCVQQESFTGVGDSRISSLCPLLDSEGIIRLQTKVTERIDVEDFRMPAVLPSKHPVVELLVLHVHSKSCHVGVQGLLSLLREKFWVLKGRKTIRNILAKCVVCRRYDAKHMDASTPTLPEHRVKDAAVFEVAGVDFAGPLFLRDKSKVWICLFTCAVYRAVHLELDSSLSTDAFIQTFRRFVARRGRPAIVYSDNGTNFTGTANAFSQLDWEKLSKYSGTERIDWRFNPPTAAWWGGWWERLIRLLKQLLRKTLGQASLTFDELATVLCECECIVNSRPLTYVSENGSDLVPITPNMFLHDIRETGVPDCDAIDSRSLNKRIRYRQKIRDSLRHRFRNEYLGQLVLHSKKKSRGLRPQEVVLIGTENSKRIDWPLALVEELIPGRDGESRLVRLKTASGVLLRPIQRVYPLEICADECPKFNNRTPAGERCTVGASSSQDEDVIVNGEVVRQEVKTRCGRRVKLPSKFLM